MDFFVKFFVGSKSVFSQFITILNGTVVADGPYHQFSGGITIQALVYVGLVVDVLRELISTYSDSHIIFRTSIYHTCYWNTRRKIT